MVRAGPPSHGALSEDTRLCATFDRGPRGASGARLGDQGPHRPCAPVDRPRMACSALGAARRLISERSQFRKLLRGGVSARVALRGGRCLGGCEAHSWSRRGRPRGSRRAVACDRGRALSIGRRRGRCHGIAGRPCGGPGARVRGGSEPRKPLLVAPCEVFFRRRDICSRGSHRRLVGLPRLERGRKLVVRHAGADGEPGIG